MFFIYIWSGNLERAHDCLLLFLRQFRIVKGVSVGLCGFLYVLMFVWDVCCTIKCRSFALPTVCEVKEYTYTTILRYVLYYIHQVCIFLLLVVVWLEALKQRKSISKQSLVMTPYLQLFWSCEKPVVLRKKTCSFSKNMETWGQIDSGYKPYVKNDNLNNF